MNANELRSHAAAVVDPYLGQPLGAAVSYADVVGGDAVIDVTLGFPAGGYEPSLRALLGRELAAAGWTGGLRLKLRSVITAHPVPGNVKPLPTLRNVPAV